MSPLLMLLLFTTAVMMVHWELAGANMVLCPSDVYVEIQKNSVINCTKSEGYAEMYWFRGTDVTVVPILWWEDGKPGGVEHGKGEFDITRDGSFEIIAAQLSHEGIYTVRVYFSDGSSKTSTVMVNILVPPQPPCPTFNVCNAMCNDSCVLIVESNGEISCYINRSRPKIDLSWNIRNQSRISFTRYDAEFDHDVAYDTWNASLKINYILDDCNGGAIVECLASNHHSLVSTVSSTIIRPKENCSSAMIPQTTMFPENGRGSLLIIIICVIVLLTVVAVAIIYMACSRIRRSQEDFQENTDPECHIPLNTPSITERKKDILLHGLRQAYEELLYIKPFPWDEPIPIGLLYTNSQCSAIVSKGEAPTSTEDLFSREFLFDNKRVLIVADLGFGKTTFTQHVVQRWIEKNDDQFLIYLLLKDVQRNTNISTAVLEMMPPDSNLNTDDIENILKTEECHVLLDGLDELAISAEKDNAGAQGKSSFRLTVDSLLTGRIPYRKLTLWVTSREVDNMQNPFPPPVTTVKLTGFSDSQVDQYITKTRQLYMPSNSVDADIKTVQEVTETTENETNHHIETESSITSDSKHEATVPTNLSFEHRVKTALQLNDIVKEFSATPLLLILIIHIIASKIAHPTKKMQNVNIHKLTTIVRMVITCLESRYVQKIRINSVKEALGDLELNLGKFAFKKQMSVSLLKKAEWVETIGEKYFDMSLAIGLLRLSKKVSGGTEALSNLAVSSYSGVEFYHQYFQEFLAAQHVPQDEEDKKLFDRYLKKCVDGKTIRYLQFMAGSQKTEECTGIWKSMVKSQKLWNNLVDCLYEDDDYNRVTSVIEEIGGKAKELGKGPVVNVQYLSNNYHLEAFASFCTMCRENDVKLRAISFRENCSIEFLSKCKLPVLKRLDFLEITLCEDEFAKIIEITAGFNPPLDNLGFITCVLPGELTDKSKERIKAAMEDSKMNIHRKKKRGPQLKPFISSFNAGKGTWDTELFPANE